jgi:hypothetical protein
VNETNIGTPQDIPSRGTGTPGRQDNQGQRGGRHGARFGRSAYNVPYNE